MYNPTADAVYAQPLWETLAAQRFLLAVCRCLLLFTIVKHLPGNSMFLVYVALICSRIVGMLCAKMPTPIQYIRFKRISYAVMPKNALMGAGGRDMYLCSRWALRARVP